MDGKRTEINGQIIKNEKCRGVLNVRRRFVRDVLVATKSLKGLEHHQIKSLDKFKKEKVMHIPTVDIYCTKHKDRKLEIYCHDHKAICCLTCMTTNHRNYNRRRSRKRIKQIAKDEKLGERIKQLSVQMRERADDCEQNMAELTMPEARD
ncbi:hypothetical protein KUTeg_010153 [Tegillarca granosa]|uniref:B box-type domain-containing protein n=1 Tax=Tegillarca granosa TaxID=220873 RepID=A0ABQ9FAX6_TEGGR|nr:hypothetical protein KUTeg_010153 [Tegillarca granosa]